MSKTVKNLLLAFSLLCIIVLVVFCIELIVLNRGRDDGGDNRQIASERPSAGADKSTEKPPASPAGNGISPGGKESPKETTSAKPTGKRYLLVYSGSENLVLYADEATFDYTQLGDDGYMFKYKGEGNANLEICPRGIPLGAEKCAETYLDGYLDGNQSFVSGMGAIRHSALKGVFVSGVNNGETFEAWVHSIPDDTEETHDDVGMTFVIRYSNNEQRDALYAVLDTLELVGVRN